MLSTMTTAARYRVVFCAVLLALPFFVTFSMGMSGIDDAVYPVFHIAESLAAGRGIPYLPADGQPGVRSPLFTAVLVAIAWLGLPVPWMALFLGAVGWSLTALGVYAVGRQMRWSDAGALAAIAVACNSLPGTSGTLASEVPWVLCLAVWATWAARTEHPRFQILLMYALLAMRLELTTAGIILLLLVYSGRHAVRRRWWLSLCTVVVSVLWVALLKLDLVTAVTPTPDLGALGQRLLSLLRLSEFYWFYIFFAAVGAIAAVQGGMRWVVAFWLGSGLLSRSVTAWAFFAMLSCCWAGLGIAVAVRWLVEYRLLRVPSRRALLAIGLLGISPLLLAEFVSVRQAQRIHRAETRTFFAEAAAYVQAHSSVDDRIMASAQMGYLAERPTLVYLGLERDVEELGKMMVLAQDQSPQWCLSTGSLGWYDLQQTGWFQRSYYEVETFVSPYASVSPVTVWRQRPTEFDLGVSYESLDVRLPDGRFWVGAAYEPDRISAGEVISVTLFVHEPSAVDAPRVATVYLRTPGEDGSFAEQPRPLSRRLVLDDPRGGRVWAEQFTMPTPADMSMGAYYLSASLFERDSDRYSQIYQDELVFPIDRVTLGYVVVPWAGDIGGARSVGANLGDRATLVAYTMSQEAEAGAPFEVTLYWEGCEDPIGTAAQHFAFVHLLDADGQLVAQHDGPPAGGHYPVQSWVPGEIVPDVHTLYLDSQLAPGTYRFQVGMYTWPTMERLQARDVDGEVLADGVVVLDAVTIR